MRPFMSSSQLKPLSSVPTILSPCPYPRLFALAVLSAQQCTSHAYLLFLSSSDVISAERPSPSVLPNIVPTPRPPTIFCTDIHFASQNLACFLQISCYYLKLSLGGQGLYQSCWPSKIFLNKWIPHNKESHQVTEDLSTENMLDHGVHHIWASGRE